MVAKPNHKPKTTYLLVKKALIFCIQMDQGSLTLHVGVYKGG